MIPSPLLPRILFVGDVIGEQGIVFLERPLPTLRLEHQVDLVVVNGENAHVAGNPPLGAAGLSPHDAERLFAAGADLITGGNHSWDHPLARAGLEVPGVLRPLNMGSRAPGRGACIIERGGVRYGVVNLASRTAIANVDHPFDVFDGCLDARTGQTDVIIVDFHAESVSEKITFAYAFDGRLAAVIGTHTHVPTADQRLLPGGTAYITDVGMTGPLASMQGFARATQRGRDPSHDHPQLRATSLHSLKRPRCIRTSRSQIPSMNARSWKMPSMLVLACFSSTRSSATRALDSSSRLAVGSSKSNIRGRATKARPIPTKL